MRKVRIFPVVAVAAALFAARALCGQTPPPQPPGDDDKVITHVVGTPDVVGSFDYITPTTPKVHVVTTHDTTHYLVPPGTLQEGSYSSETVWVRELDTRDKNWYRASSVPGKRVNAVVRGVYGVVTKGGPGGPGGPGKAPPPPVWTTMSVDLDLDADTNRDGQSNLGEDRLVDAAEDKDEDNATANPLGAVVSMGSQADLLLRRVLPSSRPDGIVRISQWSVPEKKKPSQPLAQPLVKVFRSEDSGVADKGKGSEVKTELAEQSGTENLWDEVKDKDLRMNMVGQTLGSGLLVAEYYFPGMGTETAQDKVRVTVVPDLPADAPTASASDHHGHCDKASYWDIIGEQTTGFTRQKGLEATWPTKAAKEDPYYVSRAVESADHKKVETHYYLIADKPFTYDKKTYNEDLDHYWFNAKSQSWNKSGLHKAGSTMTISFQNYRAFCQKVFDDKIISKRATLYLCVYDLDCKSQIDANVEVDEFRINGKHTSGRSDLRLVSGDDSSNKKWQVLAIEFDASMLKFPERVSDVDGISNVMSAYPKPAMNEVSIRIDKGNMGWALEVDWAVVEFRAMSPILLVHGAGGDHDFWGGLPEHLAGVDFVNAFYVRRKPKYPIEDRIDVLGPGPGKTAGTAMIDEGGKSLAEEVPKRTAAFGAFGFNVICHSKGGLWMRDYVERFMSQDKLSLASFITLSTPHYGSVLADYVNAFMEGSVLQQQFGLPRNEHIPTTSDVSMPLCFDELRKIYWPKDPRKVLEGSDYWNRSYTDLGADAAAAFGLHNIPYLRGYANHDGTKPMLWAFTANASGNPNADKQVGPISEKEYEPLDLSFFKGWSLNPGWESDEDVTFFTDVYKALGYVHRFKYKHKVLQPGDRHCLLLFDVTQTPVGDPKQCLTNDLFVTERSGAGAPYDSKVGERVPFTRVSLNQWGQDAPKAANHATIASKECGAVIRDKGYLAPLR